jgi:hypothetical protein
MNGIVARRLRKRALDETGDYFRSQAQEYVMYAPDGKAHLMMQGKRMFTLVCKGGRRLYKQLKQEYKHGRRNGN